MPLDQLFSSLKNSGNDPRAMLGSLLGGSGGHGRQPGIGGAASGALVSLLMNGKARKKISKHAGKVGGMAALAGLGYYAYQKWQQSQQAGPPPMPGQAPASPRGHAAPPPMPTDFDHAAEEIAIPTELPMKLVLAMIAAAAADGSIDPAEMRALASAIDDAPLEPDEKSRLSAALNDPPNVEDIAALAEGPEEASEIYGAALTAIELDTPSEHLFLRRLARSLKLDESLVATLHETLEKA